MSLDSSNPDFVPSIFKHSNPTNKKREEKVKRFARFNKRRLSRQSSEFKFLKDSEIEEIPEQMEEENIHVNCVDKEKFLKLQQEKLSLEMNIDELNKKLREAEAKFKNTRPPVTIETMTNQSIKFFTGLQTLALFHFVINIVRKNLPDDLPSSVSLENQTLLIFAKLRLGLLNKDLAYRFNISDALVSKIFRTLLPVLANSLKKFIVWPSRCMLEKNMPKVFKKNYSRCCCIIDCTEVFMERSSDLTIRAQTWSNYKHNNTIKYLICCTPAGAISYVSDGWGGRASDKLLTLECKFLDFIRPGDVVLADRGKSALNNMLFCIA